MHFLARMKSFSGWTPVPAAAKQRKCFISLLHSMTSVHAPSLVWVMVCSTPPTFCSALESKETKSGDKSADSAHNPLALPSLGQIKCDALCLA